VSAIREGVASPTTNDDPPQPHAAELQASTTMIRPATEKNSRTNSFLRNIAALDGETDEPLLRGNRGASTGSFGNPYANKAVEEELRILTITGPGRRNDQLNITALKLARFADLDREWLRGRLIDSCHTNGLIADDGQRSAEATIESAFAKADRDGPREIPERFVPIRQGQQEDGNTAVCRSAAPTSVLLNRVLTRSSLRSLPEPEPLIDNVLDQGTTAHLYGKWGTAKSFIALDWAASVATGRKWQGRDTMQRKVLYVAAEGAQGFKRRADAWEVGWCTMIDDEWFNILPTPINLTKAGDVGDAAALIRCNAYGLVVLDTLARCMVGADENSAKDCGAVVDAMTHLVDATPDGRGVVLGVHHAGKDGKTFRGSSAFEAGADTVYFTKRDGAAFTLSREKRKDGPQEDRHLLKLDPIPDTGSCVMSAYGVETADNRSDVLRLIMSQHFASTGASRNDLRQVAVDEGPMTKSTFFRALSDLIESGYLINEATDTRPFYRVTETTN
jgi:hypothetical protein